MQRRAYEIEQGIAGDEEDAVFDDEDVGESGDLVTGDVDEAPNVLPITLAPPVSLAPVAVNPVTQTAHIDRLADITSFRRNMS